MSPAIANGTWRWPSRRDLAILILAIVAHGVVLLALVSGARWMPQLTEPPVIEAELLEEHAPPATPAPAAIAPAPATVHAPTILPPAIVAATPAPRPAAPAGIVAPPGFTARKLVEESDATRESLRGSLGCRHEKVAALTRAEKAACAEADGERSRTAPLYAAIDPDKKAAFDGDCAKDDDWCLYRIGKGPYPGIFALGKKKKRKGWDD